MSKIYRLDYSEYDVGNFNRESKREVNWKFSLDDDEFDVMLKWSFVSGRQSIFVNSHEVVFQQNLGASVIDEKFVWDGITFHMVGTGRVPRGHAHYDYRCFELFINGILFSHSPRPGQQNLQTPKGGSVLDVLYPKLLYTATTTDVKPITSARRKYQEPSAPPAQSAPSAESAPPAAPIADLLCFDAATPATHEMVVLSTPQAVSPTTLPYSNYATPTQYPTSPQPNYGFSPVEPSRTADPFGAQNQANLFGTNPASPQQSHPLVAPQQSHPFGAIPVSPQQGMAFTFGVPQQAHPFGATPVSPHQAVAAPFGAAQQSNPFGATPVSPQQANPYGAFTNPIAEIKPPTEAPPAPPTEAPPPPPTEESPAPELMGGTCSAPPAYGGLSGASFGAAAPMDPWATAPFSAPMAQHAGGNVMYNF